MANNNAVGHCRYSGAPRWRMLENNKLFLVWHIIFVGRPKAHAQRVGNNSISNAVTKRSRNAFEQAVFIRKK